MLYAVLMAGGKGKRFWPKSRAKTPKQFISVYENKPLLRGTFERLSDLVPAENVIVVTNGEHRELTKSILPEVPDANILAEPVGKDTAPCLAYAAAVLLARDPDCQMLVMPADHFIRPKQKFQQVMRLANEIAHSTDHLVVFGIKPRYPSVGYGYIKRGGRLLNLRGQIVHRVDAFKEKPDSKTAKAYVASGDYFWNSGIFLWKLESMLEAFKQHRPDMYKFILAMHKEIGTRKGADILNKFFAETDRISIDYAILEKSDNIAMTEANFIWDDLGTWDSLEELVTKNREGNIVLAKHFGLDSKDLIIQGEGDHLIATVGVSNLVIVHTPDVTLICAKDKVDSVKSLVEAMEKNGMSQYL